MLKMFRGLNPLGVALGIAALIYIPSCTAIDLYTKYKKEVLDCECKK